MGRVINPRWTRCPRCGVVELGVFIWCSCVDMWDKRGQMVEFGRKRSRLLHAAYRLGGIAAAQQLVLEWYPRVQPQLSVQVVT